MSKISCGICKWYLPVTPTEGQCRRLPPQVMPIQTPEGVRANGFFPPVRADIWCGEFTRRDFVKHQAAEALRGIETQGSS